WQPEFTDKTLSRKPGAVQVGAVVGGWISTLFGFGKVDGFNFGSFVVAVIGAIVVLFIYRKIKS
ncbi:GlsB/YeaQ/YmgE family stress response membrane protein, partial [Escherichia coli]|uniref:GlsB/YeaQ/YmgE family stress response membrane protein n=1 Tax=Escherichia coli TaxID=562 RepID=UPI0003EFB36A